MDLLVYTGGYALTCITYLTLSLLFSFIRDKNIVTRSLVVFCLCFAAWGFGNAILFYSGVELGSTYHFLLEYFRYSGLLILLLALLAKYSSIFSVIKSGQFLFISALLLVSVFLTAQGEKYQQLAFTLILSVIIFLLIIIETIYSHSKSKLWALRPMILCLFVTLIIDFSLYAEGALFIQFEFNLLIAKSYLNFILAPLLLWSIRRTSELQVQVYISREVVFQSSVVLGAGFYLGLLALVGYYIQQFEQVWTPILQIVFLALGFILLFAVFLSHTLKANLKKYIQKNFFANKFDYRVQWLALTEELGKGGNPYLNAMNTLLLSLQAKQGILIKCENDSCKLLLDTDEAMDSKVLEEVEFIAASLSVESSIFELVDKVSFSELQKKNFHLVIPINDGHKLWGMALISQNIDEYIEIDWEVSEYLHVISIQVAHYLFQHEANEQLMENAQFAAFSRMSAFVVHDLKNILAQIQMIVSNSVKHKHNPEFIEDTFETLTHSQKRLAKVIKQLKEKKVDNTSNETFDISQAVELAIKSRFSGEQKINLSLIPDMIIQADQDRFMNVLCHVIDNALQASDAEDTILVTMQCENTNVTLCVIDQGVGMTDEFIAKKLFKPFETTKGNAGMGIGAYDAKVFTEALGGEVKVTSTVNEGTNFSLIIPLYHQ